MSKKMVIKKQPSNAVAQNAFESLNFKGLIRPGATLAVADLEKALNIKYVPPGTPGVENKEAWKFLGPYLQLRMMIEAQGFFIGPAPDQESPGFRILDSHEMADYTLKKLHQSVADNYKLAYIMSSHDVSHLKEADQKKHRYTQKQAAQCALVQQKIIFESSFF